MLHYRLDTTPTAPQHQIGADLRALLPHVGTLTTTLVLVGPPHRTPAQTVWVLSVPEAARPAVERRLMPRWFGPDAAAPLRQVAGVVERPEWSFSALLLPRASIVPLGAILARHWPSLRLDTHATGRGCVCRLWADGPPTAEARAMLTEAGWRVLPLGRVPQRVWPLLVRAALLVGRAPQLTLELGLPVTGSAGAATDAGAEAEMGAEASEADEVDGMDGAEADPFPPELPPVTTPAAQLLAQAWSAGQQPPDPDAGQETPTAGDDPAEEEALSAWPRGPGQLGPRRLEAVLERLLSDPDVAERGVTKNKLKAAGAGPDAEALLAWLDAAGLLAEPSKPDDPVVRWREPRRLLLLDQGLLAERLRVTPLPDAAAVAQVRAAFAPVVPPGGLP